MGSTTVPNCTMLVPKKDRLTVYRYLSNEGIEYLREYLHLPAEIVPATLKKTSRPAARGVARDERGGGKGGDWGGKGGRDDGYRRGGFGGEGGKGGGFGRGGGTPF